MTFQKAIVQAPQCPACGTIMKLIPAGTSKTKVDDEGNPVKYGAFYSCPNNRECGGKTIKYTEPPKPTLTSKSDIPVIKEISRDVILVEMLNEINSKLDLIVSEIIPKEQ